MSEGDGLVLSYGSTVYSSTKTDGDPKPAPTSGLEESPNLWFGFCILMNPICSPLISIFTFSNTLKVPDDIVISTNFGTISGIPLSR